MYTCKRALIVSIGFVIIVVVNPPNVPATHWINNCETGTGNSNSNSSDTETYYIPDIPDRINYAIQNPNVKIHFQMLIT